MKILSLIIVAACTLTSCGALGKYSNSQHSVFAKMLTDTEKNQIAHEGEITREIELTDPGLLKGTLRVIKTTSPGVYNFVETGQWIYHGKSGRSANTEFRDTIAYDTNGNTVLRRVYEQHKGTFQLTNDWRSEIVDNSFYQHVKVYDHNILRTEYSRRTLDYLTPKSDLQKHKVPVGTEKAYLPNGTLSFSKTYDQNGNLLRKVNHAK